MMLGCMTKIRKMPNYASRGDGYCIAAAPPFRNRVG